MNSNDKKSLALVIGGGVIVVALGAALFIYGGNKSKTKENPVVALIDTIREERNASRIEYGAAGFNGDSQTQISTINCHVFDKAARTEVKGGTGDWMAMTESAGLAVVFGCSKDDKGLIRYEEMRRGLAKSWASDIAKLPENVRIQAINSKAGQTIQKQINTMPSMDMVCRQRKAVEQRVKGSSTASFGSIQAACGTGGQNKHEDLCNEAAYVIRAAAMAKGDKDKWSWIAELFARYHRMSNVCTPDDKQAYLAFHSTVPREIFKGYGYRLSIARDTVLECALDGTMKNIGGRINYKESIHDYRSSMMNICSKNTSFPGVYGHDMQPERITRAAILEGPWNYNPEEIDNNPDSWRAGECGTITAQAMVNSGANPANPEALRRYCAKLNRR